jgi:DNA-binding PadR family transcriptional regulator
MNPTRLFVLGALAKHGPMYGHQIRRDARTDRADLWSDVRPGSLYGALHRMAAEGLIEPVRTEQSGNLPARTVYAITTEGQRELRALRTEALEDIGLRPDPVDLALVMSGDLDAEVLRGYIENRIKMLDSQAARHAHHAADDLVAEHTRLRVAAELAWHQLVLDRIGKPSEAGEPSEPSEHA